MLTNWSSLPFSPLLRHSMQDLGYRSIYYCFIQCGLHIFQLIIFTMKEPVSRCDEKMPATSANLVYVDDFGSLIRKPMYWWKGTTSGSWSGGTSHFHSLKKQPFGGDYQILRGTVNA